MSNDVLFDLANRVLVAEAMRAEALQDLRAAVSEDYEGTWVVEKDGRYLVISFSNLLPSVCEAERG